MKPAVTLCGAITLLSLLSGCATMIEERVVEGRLHGATQLLADDGNALEQVTGPVWSFKFGWYRNLLLVSGDEVAVFDPISVDAAQALSAALTERLPGKRVTLVGYSHSHHDHIRGAAKLSSDGVRVVAHQNVKVDLELVADSDVVMPNDLVEGDAKLLWAGIDIELVHLPRSHSTGYLAVWLPAQRVLYAPDLVAKRGGLAFENDNFLPGIIKGQQRLIELGATTIVPGHYALCTPQDLTATRERLIGIREIVAEELKTQPGYDVTKWDPAAFTRLRRKLNAKYGEVQGFEDASLMNTYYLLLGYIGGF